MSLRIAFDIDGVFADLESAYGKVVRTLFSETPADSEPPDAAEPADDLAASDDIEPVHPPGLTLSRWQESEVWREIEETENFWASLPPLEPGILKRVQDLAERHRWEIFFVTQRPDTAGETVQRQTQRWLIEQGFDLPSVVVMSSSRGRLAEAMRLDYLIDDSPLHCADAASESDTKPVLVVRHDDPQRRRGAREMGIAIVPTVAAALDLLEQAQEMGDQPGFWKRLTDSFRGSRG